MRKFNCTIELEGCGDPAPRSEFQIDGALRSALEWLVLAGRRDSAGSRHSESIDIEHIGAEVVIRINKTKAAEIAIAQRIS